MKIGILVIATNKYIIFAEQLLESIRKYFMKDTPHEVTLFVFTNHRKVPAGAVRIHQKHRKFPYPTLMRYHMFSRNRAKLESMDYLYYCDVDMQFVAPVGEEILGDRVATLHPYFYNTEPAQFSYERRPESTAFIPVGEGKHYFCGGFNGGKKDVFLEMAEKISRNVDADKKKGLVAEWHDESHLNRYMLDNPPTLILPPSYCYPEGQSIPFEPKLLALEKTHLKSMLRDTWTDLLVKKLKNAVKKLIGRK